MTSILGRVVGRILPGTRNRNSDAQRDDRVAADAGSVPALLSPSNDGWRLLDISRDDQAWDITLEVPTNGDVALAALVLVGRSSQREVSASMLVGDRAASATVSAAALRGFDAETLDLWVDANDSESTATRGRVGLATADLMQELATTSIHGLRWYATVNGNLSAEAGPPIIQTNDTALPTIVSFTEDNGSVRVDVAGLGAAQAEDPRHYPDLDDGPDETEYRDTLVDPGNPALLLVGRKSRLEVLVPFSAANDGWTAEIHEGELTVFGLETVDV
ncbi:MAG: hypothetical protein QM650_10205, partial [Microlunatus sp.]